MSDLDTMTASEVDAEIQELMLTRDALIVPRLEAQQELERLNHTVRTSGHMQDSAYRNVCMRQERAKETVRAQDRKLAPIKLRLRELNIRMNQIKSDTGRSSVVAVEVDKLSIVFNRKVVALRAKYIDFAKDGTRVASMRRMASEFVDDLTVMLREMSQEEKQR